MCLCAKDRRELEKRGGGVVRAEGIHVAPCVGV